jgi:flagellin FlaB
MLKAFKLLGVTIVLSLLLITSVACKAEYSLHVIVGGGQGVVTPSSGTYTEGTSVTIAAIPDSGWEFDRWDGDISGDENPTTVRISRDKIIQAYFVEIQVPTPTPTPLPERPQEAVYQGLATAQASMQVSGSVYAEGNSGLTSVDNVSFQLSSVLQNQDVDLGKCVVNYQDSRTIAMNITCGSFTGLLKPNEVRQITVNLSAYNLGVYDTFTIEIIPPTGATIQIRRTLPGAINTVMNLY